MAGKQRRTAPGLGEFLDALEMRLRTLDPEQVIAALMTHAGQLRASSRQGFLEIFPEPGVTPATGCPTEHDHLLADIEAFAERARAGEFDGEQEYYDDPFDNDYWDHGADTSWVEEADALFAMAGQEFLAGQLDLAREAYGRLLHLFRPVHKGGSDLEAWMLETTDIDEVAARYLRCVYETTPAQHRGETVHREYAGLGLDLRRLRLHDIAAARRGDLPDLDAFLPAWIDALLNSDSGLAPDPRQRLLTEAVLAHRGIDGLAELARRPGTHRPTTYLDWIDALAKVGRIQEAADAARQALTLSPTTCGPLAQAADRLAELATRLDDSATAVEARCRAWRTEPTHTRLLALAAAAQAAGTLGETLTAEASHTGAGTDRLSCELFLLAGQVDTAATVLAHAGPLGWSHPTHPGPVVLPYLLVAATATQPPPDATSRLGQAFTAIDTEPGWSSHAYQQLNHTDEFRDMDEYTNDVDAPDRLPGPPPPSLTTLLIRRLTEDAATGQQRQRWQAIAADAVGQRVDAIVSNKHRRAYARAAAMVVAYAETLAITGADTSAGIDHVSAVRQRYPRHTAFRAELDAAASDSALLTAAGSNTPAARAAQDRPRRA